jgi:branched-chain amino acid aminotransferase
VSVWWNGGVHRGAAIPLADDRGLLLGDGLYETVLVRDGEARFLGRHLARLSASAERLGFTLPDDLAATIAAALPGLRELEGDPRRGVLRVTVTRGTGRGLTPPAAGRTLVLGFGALPGVDPTLPAEPATAWFVEWPRIDPRDPLAGHKVTSSMARVQARITARNRGADVALLTTVDGDVCEADAANVFAVIDGVVVTPSLDRGVLPGITRARCIEALARDGRPATERRVEPGEMERASEAFLTSSLDGVRPLRAVGTRTLVAPGPVASRLARCIENLAPGTEELMPNDGSPAHNEPR